MGEQEGLYLYLSISVCARVCVGWRVGVADEERVTGRTVWVDYFPAYLLGCRLAALRNIWELFSVPSPLSTRFPFHLIPLVTTPSLSRLIISPVFLLSFFALFYLHFYLLNLLRSLYILSCIYLSCSSLFACFLPPFLHSFSLSFIPSFHFIHTTMRRFL